MNGVGSAFCFVLILLIDSQIERSYLGRMSRMVFGILTTLSLLLPAALCAQRSFPSPSFQLHDEKFKVADTSHPPVPRIVIFNGRPVAIPSTSTSVNSLAFSQDGSLVAAGKNYGRLVVWDTATRKVACAIDTGFASVGQIAISPDKQSIAAAAGSGLSIKVWHIPDGEVTTTLDNPHANVPRLTFMTVKLIYTRDPKLLIVFSAGMPGSTDEFDTSSGKIVRSFPGENDPVLSTDGSMLVTLSGPEVVVRSTADWTIQRRFHKLTEPEQPVYWDEKEGIFLFKDFSDEHLFVAARTSDGQMLPYVKLANLPNSMVNWSDFASIDPHTDFVFGHSARQLWILDLKTGNTCLSQDMWSDSGSLSPDGSLLAGAFEPETPTDDQKEAGVKLWKTADLARACHMQ